MASTHKLKNLNGDKEVSSQEKSIEINHKQGIDSPSNELIQGFTNKTEIPKEFVDETVIENPIVKPNMNFHIVENNMKYDFDDILLIPKSQSDIKSRSEINPFYKNELTNYKVERLPLFTAPMDSVVSNKNMRIFIDEKFNVVLPRTENYKKHGSVFNSFGLNEYLGEYDEYDPMNFVLLDVANGHMSAVLKWCNDLKKLHPKIKIMAGNIASPKAYKTYCDSGVVDYVRVGIGNGNGCLTTQQTGIGYPMASLIIECNAIKILHRNPVKIIADGGMKKYSDIIKALALGADYVMIGGILSKTLESSAPNYWKGIKINPIIAHNMYNMGFNIQKKFRGMSTKEAQIAMGNTILKTSEGVVRKFNVEYTLKQWVDNYIHYQKSAMSYANANSLNSFIGRVEFTTISNNAFNRFNK